MMTDPTCESCKHSRPTITDDFEPLLKCHRYPPQLFVLAGVVNQAWPDANEPCGEYQP